MKFPRLDQASELRSLIDRSALSAARVNSSDNADFPRTAHTIAVTSGKGGVGKSILSLNLAIALAQSGQKVCLLDANLGLGNLDLLCGLNGYWNLSHVINRARSLKDIVLKGPADLSLIPGASGLTELADLANNGRESLLAELARLDQDYDYLIIDCGSGIHQTVRQFAAAADTVLLVSTLETTSLADTYAALKVYHSSQLADVRLVFNRAETRSAQQAMHNMRTTARQFLNTDISVLGCLPDDPLLARSVALRQPFLLQHQETFLGQAFRHLANLLKEQRSTLASRDNSPFIKRFQADSLSAA